MVKTIVPVWQIIQGAGPWPWPWLISHIHNHGHWPWPLLVHAFKGHGHQPWPWCADIQESWSPALTMVSTSSKGHGHLPYPWLFVYCLGHVGWPWSWVLLTYQGHGLHLIHCCCLREGSWSKILNMLTVVKFLSHSASSPITPFFSSEFVLHIYKMLIWANGPPCQISDF